MTARSKAASGRALLHRASASVTWQDGGSYKPPGLGKIQTPVTHATDQARRRHGQSETVMKATRFSQSRGNAMTYANIARLYRLCSTQVVETVVPTVMTGLKTTILFENKIDIFPPTFVLP